MKDPNSKLNRVSEIIFGTLLLTVSLKILYKGDEAMKTFVEEEMKKYQFSPEEKRSVKYQPIFV